ncbi:MULTISPECIES: alpha/beta fold hydrolase [unclassified Butyrivibrio]|uniref:alpha/beta fold hydrolase n=1 Tax=unclassified Butyrivibrio TaxID=2639466 RepID=UPI0003F6C897|nr:MULTISPECIES: alpha/beta hydrolase [unclassified Butyrivibrio]
MNTEIDGLKIYYRDEGEGPLLILLHGWGSNVDLFDGIFRFASKKYHVVGMDMPGFGKSDEPKDSWEVSDFVTFVIHFIKKLYPDEKEIMFLGHSMGGRVIIKMIGTKTEEELGFRIPRVILTDSAGIKPVPSGKQSGRTKRYKFYKNVLIKTGIAKAFPNTLENLKKKFGSADYAAASPVMRGSLVKVVNEDLTQYMPSVNMPALLIWGDQDTATPLSDGKKMEELMPEAGLAVIPGAGHYSFLDNQYMYNKILGSFLKIEM